MRVVIFSYTSYTSYTRCVPKSPFFFPILFKNDAVLNKKPTFLFSTDILLNKKGYLCSRNIKTSDK